MKKFYVYIESINEITNQDWIFIKWWDPSLPSCPTGSINSAKELMTIEQQNIYNEYISNPVLYDPEDRITDAEKFPESQNPPA